MCVRLRTAFVGFLLLTCCLVVLSCSSDDSIAPAKKNDEMPQLLSFSFKASRNLETLIEDVEGKIVSDSIVDCWIPYLVLDKHLVADISCLGGAFLDGVEYDHNSIYDWSSPIRLQLQHNGKTRDFIIYVHTYTGIPVLWIDTQDNINITSKEEYVAAHLRLVEDVITRSAGQVTEGDIKIKGRGNRSWWDDPKKSYSFKFNEKVSLLDEPADKSWCLLPNYNDKTMLRNQTAMHLGRMSCLEYTPRMHFVELMLNGKYNGTYQLSEKLKISKNRVDLGKEGFLMEIDAHAPYEADARMFTLPHLSYPVNIKDPDVDYNTPEFEFVRDFLFEADSVLYSDSFQDPEKGWQKYFDKDALVDWYLINEISKNLDMFWSSSFMNLEHGGKIKMGPLWDFDQSFGTEKAESPFGFFAKEIDWFKRFWEDPYFVGLVKERFNYFYANKDSLYDEINKDAVYLQYAAVENNNRWNVLYHEIWRDYRVWGSYQNEVVSLKEWLVKRFEWLDQNL